MHTDNVLWFRMLVIYAVAVAGKYVSQVQALSREEAPVKAEVSFQTCARGVMFVLERPEDPVEHQGKDVDPNLTPSLWAMPEVKAFRELFQLMSVTFDQGALGHPQVKPTRILTDSWKLYKLPQGNGWETQTAFPCCVQGAGTKDLSRAAVGIHGRLACVKL